MAPETQGHFPPSTQGKVQRSGQTKDPKPGGQTCGTPGVNKASQHPRPYPNPTLRLDTRGLGRLMTNRIRQSFQGPLTAPGRKLQTRGGHLDPGADPGSTGVATETWRLTANRKRALLGHVTIQKRDSRNVIAFLKKTYIWQTSYIQSDHAGHVDREDSPQSSLKS